MVNIRPATAGNSSAIAALMAEAFVDDPAWAVFYPDPDTRPAKLLKYYQRRVRRRPEWVDVAMDDARLVGAMFWEPPRPEAREVARKRSSLWRRFLSRFPRGRGLAHTIAVEEHRPEEPHWYLHDIATSPHARGRGIGTALLHHRLDIIDSSDAPLAALEATTPDSQRLYERFGFHPVATVPSIPEHASTIMIRRHG